MMDSRSPSPALSNGSATPPPTDGEKRSPIYGDAPATAKHEKQSPTTPAAGVPPMFQVEPSTLDDRSVEKPSSSPSVPMPSSGAPNRGKGFWGTLKNFGYTPRRCRWDSDRPPRFGLGLNLLFSFGATFSVANLYYNHPILNILANDFGVSYERISIVPTVMQAGYATGLLFICPLGDIVRRRALILYLTCFTTTMWLALCLTSSFEVFAALSFITSITTVTPQLLLPLVGDVAPPHKRAHALSIVVSGLLAGMLLARVLSGVVTEYSSWRNVYWIAFGMQYLIVILLYLFLPDIPPPIDPYGTRLSYPRILLSILRLLTQHPVLAQSCLIGLLTSATFTNYWTTLTFLLSSPPFSYNSLVIGCFAFIGLIAMFFGPPYSKFLLARVAPLHAIVLSEVICLAGVLAGTLTGTFSVSGPVIQAFAIDLGLQTSQVANRAAIYEAAPHAKSRVNTAFMLAVFAGQITGTAVGNAVYTAGERAQVGRGWLWSGSASIGFVGGALVVCALRGPWETRWGGWKGGWGLKRKSSGSGCEGDEVEAGTKTGDDPVRRTEDDDPGPKEGADSNAAEEWRAERSIEEKV